MSFKGQGQVAHTSCKLPLNFRKGKKRDKNLQTKIFRVLINLNLLILENHVHLYIFFA